MKIRQDEISERERRHNFRWSTLETAVSSGFYFCAWCLLRVYPGDGLVRAADSECVLGDFVPEEDEAREEDNPPPPPRVETIRDVPPGHDCCRHSPAHYVSAGIPCDWCGCNLWCLIVSGADGCAPANPAPATDADAQGHPRPWSWSHPVTFPGSVAPPTDPAPADPAPADPAPADPTPDLAAIIAYWDDPSDGICWCMPEQKCTDAVRANGLAGSGCKTKRALLAAASRPICGRKVGELAWSPAREPLREGIAETSADRAALFASPLPQPAPADPVSPSEGPGTLRGDLREAKRILAWLYGSDGHDLAELRSAAADFLGYAQAHAVPIAPSSEWTAAGFVALANATPGASLSIKGPLPPNSELRAVDAVLKALRAGKVAFVDTHSGCNGQILVTDMPPSGAHWSKI